MNSFWAVRAERSHPQLAEARDHALCRSAIGRGVGEVNGKDSSPWTRQLPPSMRMIPDNSFRCGAKRKPSPTAAAAVSCVQAECEGR
jgi:hypothetical protein